MSFREKMAWVQLIGCLAVYSVYFWIAAEAILNGHEQSLAFVFIASVIVLTVIMVVPAIILAIRGREEAEAPEDERERAIRLRATSVAWVILNGAVWCAAAAGIVFDLSPIAIANLALAALVISDLVRWGTQIALIRASA